MKLVLENASEFKRMVDAISALIDEAEFVIDETGVKLKATDPSQISMVDFSLEKKAFKTFEVEALSKIGLDLDYLSQVMARAKNSDSLSLELDEANGRLNVEFAGNSKRSFAVPLLDVSQQELPSPKLEFDAEIEITAGAVQDALKDAALVSSHISLGVDSSNFFMKASSSKGDWNYSVSKKEGIVHSLEAKKEANSMFPLDYLQDILKGASSADKIALCLKSNHPLKLSYSIGSARLTYFLAPRIEG
ncbi:MAG: proliferating cell nuclear antigen (pcna) [Candidatus Diapherotrites archaeon]